MNTKKQTCNFVRCRKIIHVSIDTNSAFCEFHFKVEKQKFILFVKKFGLADVKEGINTLFMLDKYEYREIEQKAVQIVNDSKGAIEFHKKSDIEFNKWWLDWIRQEKLVVNVK